MSSVIRRKHIETTRRVVSGEQFNYQDLEQQAATYLESVKEQAEALLANAQREAATIREEARRAGWEEAHSAAEEAARERVDEQLGSLLPAVQQTISTVQNLRQQWLQRWEANALQLALGIAERVIRREVTADINVTRTWLRESLELASGCQQLRVRLNPHDYELLHNQTESLRTEFMQLADAEIVPDASVSPGGCCLDTEYGCIDQQVETQLTRIRQALE